MPVETSTTLAGLDDTYPLGGDPKSQGDDHLRLIKSVLKAQFPGANGDGFSVPITLTETALNGVVPSGTRMPFAQAAAPTGWVKDVSDSANNRMLRVVTGTGGGIAGTDSPILNNTSIPAHTHSTPNHTHTGSTAYTGAHTHTSNYAGTVTPFVQGGGDGRSVWHNGVTQAATSSAGAHSHTVTVDSGGAGTSGTISAVSWAPRYIDMIICTKS